MRGGENWVNRGDGPAAEASVEVSGSGLGTQKGRGGGRFTKKV